MVLTQSLGSTRARCAQNRPLEWPGTMGGITQGWARHPSRGALPRLITTISALFLTVFIINKEIAQIRIL